MAAATGRGVIHSPTQPATHLCTVFSLGGIASLTLFWDSVRVLEATHWHGGVRPHMSAQSQTSGDSGGAAPHQPLPSHCNLESDTTDQSVTGPSPPHRGGLTHAF